MAKNQHKKIKGLDWGRGMQGIFAAFRKFSLLSQMGIAQAVGK